MQRNQLGLGVRLYGECYGVCGAGIYRLCSSFNHSCYPNAVWRPLDGAMVVISTRSILVDEEVCVTYHDLSKPGVTRKEGLLRSHSFEASVALRSLGQHSWKQSGNMFLMIIRFSLYCAAYLLSHGVWQLVLEVGFGSWFLELVRKLVRKLVWKFVWILVWRLV